jgi:hypothetical protein
LEAEKVKKFYLFIKGELEKIEKVLLHTTNPEDREVRIIETRELMPRTLEQKAYARAYNALNAQIFANKNY